MSRIVFLLEEYSMKVLLDGLLPRLFPQLSFLCVPHEGKQDLEKSIPRKLRAWREPGVRFCVVRDNDGADCRALKRRLVNLCREANRKDVLVRIACQELEAWYFGAPDALADVFGREELRRLHRQAKFRDPDVIDRPARTLTSLIAEFRKVSGARRMAARMTRDNSSKSFQSLILGIERIRQATGDRAAKGGDISWP
jgi:hypothetical protein